MSKRDVNKAIDALAARRAERLAEENDNNFEWLLDLLEGRVDPIGEPEKQRFIRLYRKGLESGQYIGRKGDKLVISNKHPEKAAKQLENFDEYIKEIFIRV